MATTNYTGYTSSKEPATVTTLPAPVVEAQKMGTVAPIKVPTPAPYDTSKYTSTINSVTGSLQAQADALMREQEAQQKLAQAQGVSSDIATLTSQMGGKSADTANLYQNTGVNTAFKQLQDINAQATGLRNEAQAIPIANRLQAQKLGIAGTESQVQNVNYDQLQQNALKALSLGQQAAIAQADFNTAKNLADQQIDMKYEQMGADLKAKQLQLASLEKYELTPAQERAKEALARQYKKEDEEMAAKLQDEKDISNMIIEAMPNAPADVTARAKKLAESGASKLAVAQALGVYGGDFLKNELLKEQLKTEKAQRAKIYADMGAKGSVSTATGQVSTATDLQNATANLKLTEAQSKALAFGQRAINADRALQARLESYDPTTIFSASGRLLRTDNARAFERDLGDFITAVLRKESGATITEDEFDRFIPLYSPQGIMTNKNDIAQTNIKRQGAIDALISEAGPASAALASYKNSNEQGQFVSTGNQLADDYVRNSMNAVNKVNTSMSTPNAVNAGYTDNQK